MDRKVWSIGNTDSVRPVIYNGAMDIRESSNQFAYNFNGSLTMDGTRNIALIEYDDCNNPRRIQFANGCVTSYVYTALGEKLRTIHYTAMPNIAVEYGKRHELSQEEILSVDSTDYLLGGTAIYENGRFSKYLFGEGYIGMGTSAGNTQELSAYYFNKDHLGSIRKVVDENGKVLQANNYYPFGMPYTDNPIDNASLQKYKYNGKELDLVHGLNTYDYGARQYNPVIPTWDRVDPLSEKYYNISPYAYCLNNPVNAIDPDGRKVRPAGIAELKMIQNTLPLEARQYVVLNTSGFIDKQVLDSYSGSSLNVENLKLLVASTYVIDVCLDDKFEFADPNGNIGYDKMNYVAYDSKYDEKDTKGETINGLSSGESGFMGKTLFPDRDGLQNSTNENIQVIINRYLSPAGAAEVYSHEGNGHALLYIQNGGNHKGASHQPVDGLWIEGNTRLMDMIINSKKETIKNMRAK
jgi:RHS repeat-associated protein